MSAVIDFETYSAAGYIRRADGKWRCSNPRGGLTAVGAARYAEDESTRVISLAYAIDENPCCLWLPWMPPPQDLLEHVQNGGILEAHNSFFEFCVWNYCCVRLYKFPTVPITSFRCSSAKARGYGLPGGLENASSILNLGISKDKRGKTLISVFSIPNSIDFNKIPVDSLLQEFYNYNVQDVVVEKALSSRLPELSDEELKIWKLDQKINERGVGVDKKAVRIFKKSVVDAQVLATAELAAITEGAVTSGSQTARIREWLENKGLSLEALDSETVSKTLQNAELTGEMRRILELREILAQSSVKKLEAFELQACADSRIRGLFVYHGADTGRFTGRGVQPQNLPRGSTKIKRCNCGKTYGAKLDTCPYCKTPEAFSDVAEWDEQAFDDCVKACEQGASKEVYVDTIGAVASCLRGLFKAEDGKRFIVSDYSAIEAVILAEIAGEKWRQEIFRTHGKIYEESASKILGVPIDSITPAQRKVGKVAELASGYQGGGAAWKRFGADEYLTDNQIIEFVKAWRAASPSIVNLWYKTQDAASYAIIDKSRAYAVGKTIWQFDTDNDCLCCQLPSGRLLRYHAAKLLAGRITYKAWEQGAWTDQETYGGKLVENIVQAVARDILCHAMINLDTRGYDIVMHVHDEIICEMPENKGSVEEMEEIMNIMPTWAEDWSIKAKGGWAGKRYKK